ncbi:uncharacterized protein LOC141597439 [Silene latifolia]|uniref:uncharacterized protein LOC141597439 n=1 Tax=Silene latifolia TaxID=37657 RepID=UPI003D786529
MGFGFFYKGLRREDEEDELEIRLFPILEEDDTEKFNKYLEDKKEKVKDTVTSCMILDVCLWKVAKKCTVVMLKHSSTREYNLLHYFCPTLLDHIATVWEDPQFLQFMYQHCPADRLSNQTFLNILPIHGILLDIMNEDPFSRWYKGDSLIKLIILLISAPKVRPRLECARLVAENTSSINEVALGLFHSGDVKELAALLLLTYDHLFHSFKSGLTTVSHDGLPTISSADMVSQAVHGEIPDVYALVYLFNKVGCDLSNFYTSMPEEDNPADVILKVASLIKNAGFTITYKDVDLAREHSFKFGVINPICEALGVESYNGVNFGNKKLRFPSVYCVPRCATDHDDYKYLGHRRHDHLYRQQVRQYSSVPQNHKISASKLAQPSSSLRNVAFLAMRLKRGIRLL